MLRRVQITLLPDDIWEVTVSGTDTDAESFADQMEAIPLVEVEPFTPSRALVDPDSIIDARMTVRDDHVEIARLAWSGGKVVVVRGPGGGCCETYTNSIVVTPKDFNPAGIGLDCRDYSQVILSDDKRALLLVVTQSPGYRIQAVADGPPTHILLQPALGDREVGLLDLTGVAAPQSIEVNITERNGKQVACVQN